MQLCNRAIVQSCSRAIVQSCNRVTVQPCSSAFVHPTTPLARPKPAAWSAKTNHLEGFDPARQATPGSQGFGRRSQLESAACGDGAHFPSQWRIARFALPASVPGKPPGALAQRHHCSVPLGSVPHRSAGAARPRSGCVLASAEGKLAQQRSGQQRPAQGQSPELPAQSGKKQHRITVEGMRRVAGFRSFRSRDLLPALQGRAARDVVILMSAHFLPP